MTRSRGHWTKRLLRRYRQSQDGATTIEFTLVIVPFLTVFLCICETGMMLFTEYALQNATQEMGRAIRTGQITTSDGTIIVEAHDFKERLCTAVKVIPNCDEAIRISVDNSSTFSTLAASTPDLGASSLASAVGDDPFVSVYNPGGRTAAVSVMAIYDWKFWFPFTAFLANMQTADGSVRRLQGVAVFRNEPF